jgi:hypothetical protein
MLKCSECRHYRAPVDMQTRLSTSSYETPTEVSQAKTEILRDMNAQLVNEIKLKVELLKVGNDRWPAAPLTQSYCAALDGEALIFELKNADGQCKDHQTGSQPARACSTCKHLQRHQNPYARLGSPYPPTEFLLAKDSGQAAQRYRSEYEARKKALDAKQAAELLEAYYQKGRIRSSDFFDTCYHVPAEGGGVTVARYYNCYHDCRYHSGFEVEGERYTICFPEPPQAGSDGGHGLVDAGKLLRVSVSVFGDPATTGRAFVTDNQRMLERMGYDLSTPSVGSFGLHPSRSFTGRSKNRATIVTVTEVGVAEQLVAAVAFTAERDQAVGQAFVDSLMVKGARHKVREQDFEIDFPKKPEIVRQDWKVVYQSDTVSLGCTLGIFGTVDIPIMDFFTALGLRTNIRAREPFRANGFEGQAIRFESAARTVHRGLVSRANGRFYFVQALALDVDERLIDKYFESFKIKPVRA